MAEDETPAVGQPAPEAGTDKEANRQRRLANLRPPIRPGEVLNPKGINGRAQRDAFVAFADAADPDAQDGKSRIQQVDEAIFKKAKKGSDQAQKLFVEQYRGRARQHVQVTGENDGPVRVTYDAVRQKLEEITKAAIGAGAGTDDAGDPQPDED